MSDQNKRKPGKSTFKINHIEQSNFSDVKVFSSGYERTGSKKEPRDLANFGSYSMHFVLSGAGILEICGKSHSINANQIFFIFPNMPIKYYPEKQHPWRYSWMDFYGSKVSEILTRLDVSPLFPVIDAPPSIGDTAFERSLTFGDVVSSASQYGVRTRFAPSICSLS